MATIHIDNKPHTVRAGDNLLHTCLSLGFDIPYFCWHPALGSVGACRLCAVKLFKDENDSRGKIVMSCMTPVSDAMRISVNDPEVREFRKSVIEWLMINHPHDCPVCDEGGECHLQDMTVMTGHVYRRYRFKKRTYENQNLGPFVNHEMNRCIQCYRCVRFYRDYAGARDLNVFEAHDHVYFGRHGDGTLESVFSGNLVEICPTGVFTDKTLKKHYTRKWDLQTAPSICVHCALGCNTIPGERYGHMRRIRNRYNREVNGYFLCDRGRFGYEFVNSERRIRSPLLRAGSGLYAKQLPASKEEVLEYLSGLFSFGARVIGIGSPRASLEANYALRTLVGPENFHLGFSESESRLIALAIDILQKGPVRTPSLREVALSDAVFVLGEDILNVAPMLGLAVRQALRNEPLKTADRLKIPRWHDNAVRNATQDKEGPFYSLTPHATKMDDMATRTYYAAPDDIARIGFAVANALNADAPRVNELSDGELRMAQEIAEAFKRSARPLIISGISCYNESIIEAAANVARALQAAGKQVLLSFIVHECNSMGLALAGGEPLEAAVKKAREGAVDTAIILENDIYRRTDRQAVDALFQGCKHVIVVDALFTPTASQADVLLPACTFAESDGTLVSNEGRAQRFFKVFQRSDGMQESWRWLCEMLELAKKPEAKKWKNFGDLTTAMADSSPLLAKTSKAAPPADFRIAGLRVARQPHRYSGRTSIKAQLTVHEPKTPDDPDSPLSFSMEGYSGIPPSPLIPRFWYPGWNSVQALNKFQQEVGGPLVGGNPQIRLIEPKLEGETEYFRNIPPPFDSSSSKWLVIPHYHIFGSEELSALAAGISEQTVAPYLGLGLPDTERLYLRQGQEAEVRIGERMLSLKVKYMPSLPAGTIAIPAGIAGLEGIVFPAYAESIALKKSGEEL